MATAAKITFDQLFAGASPAGQLEASYLALVLTLMDAAGQAVGQAIAVVSAAVSTLDDLQEPPQEILDVVASLNSFLNAPPAIVNDITSNPPQQVIDYLTSLAGRESLAVVDVSRQLNTLRERYARG